jgi:nucleotidyltransferase substrate binding protein (TIGR01987 family)
MDRLTERLAIARRALSTLEESLKASTPTAIERDAAIKRFEYSTETAWKAAQQYLRVVEGIDVASPKSAIRACRESGILTTEQATNALGLTDDRNLAAHTYNEELAVALFARLPGHAALLASWLDAMAHQPSA